MDQVIDNQQVAVIENSIKVFETAPAILLKHQTRASKALTVAGNIIDQWSTAFVIADPTERITALAAADERSMKFLANCTEASEQMRDARKAITQLMDMLREMYTKEENSLDPKKGELPKAIQQNRNLYAAEVIKEQERQKKLAEAKAAKEKEANECRAYINSTISRNMYEFLAQKKMLLTESFTKITLENFEEKSAGLMKLSVQVAQDKFSEAIRYDMPKLYRHDDTESNMLKIKTHEAFDFQAFYSRYTTEISELKQSLIDRLPSKKTELLEAKRKADAAEQERLAELERQRQAQIQRDKDMAKANAEKKKKLEEENRIAQEKEKQRLADMELLAEQNRAEMELKQKQREQEERDRLATEAEENRLKAEQDAELKRQADDALTMFNQTAETVTAGGPEVRSAIVITVVHAAGWVELFTFWFQNAGIKASLEECEKMTFEKLKKFAEKSAKDSGTKKGIRIESKMLTYSDTVSAVNRKVK